MRAYHLGLLDSLLLLDHQPLRDLNQLITLRSDDYMISIASVKNFSIILFQVKLLNTDQRIRVKIEYRAIPAIIRCNTPKTCGPIALLLAESG